MNFGKILRTSSVQWQLARDYAFKTDLKIKWIRPEKIPCTKPKKSGDLGKLPKINENELLLHFKNSKELQDAEPVVHSLFQLDNNPLAETSRYLRDQVIKEVQRHPLDYGSMEAKLAHMTVRIRSMQEQLDKFPRNIKLKVALKELIDKRKKFLKYLRRWDYRRFEWMLEKLDLVYKPPPTEFHWVTRKESLQKLTDAHCEKIKEDRLAEYRKVLNEQKIPFLEEAIKKMEFVRKEQLDLEIPVTVTEEQIADFKRELDYLKSVQNTKTEDKE